MNFNHYIQHPEFLDRETLYTLRNYVALHPCHQVARLLMLQNLFILHDPTFDEELRAAAFYMTDRTTLFNILEAQEYKITPERRNVPQTKINNVEDLIDNFLDNIPKEESSEHKPTIIDATVDYMAYIMSKHEEQSREEGEKKRSNASSLIDSFLEKDGGKITISENPPSEADSPHANVTLENDKDDLEGFYTESLAKVYIKQGNYSKALEIIKQLNLNSSEKNTYFADQIRFLEKIIAVTSQNKQ